jgi:hypothetical protein
MEERTNRVLSKTLIVIISVCNLRIKRIIGGIKKSKQTISTEVGKIRID